MKIRVRKRKGLWWVIVEGPIPTSTEYVFFTDALARIQVEYNPEMKAECDRKALAQSHIIEERIART